MELEYEFQTGPSSYDDELCEEYFDTESFVYEASYKQVENAVVDIVFNEYFSQFFKDKSVKEEFKIKLKSFITNLDDEIDFEEFYSEALHEYFEDEAAEQFRNR